MWAWRNGRAAAGPSSGTGPLPSSPLHWLPAIQCLNSGISPPTICLSPSFRCPFKPASRTTILFSCSSTSSLGSLFRYPLMLITLKSKQMLLFCDFLSFYLTIGFHLHPPDVKWWWNGMFRRCICIITISHKKMWTWLLFKYNYVFHLESFCLTSLHKINASFNRAPTSKLKIKKVQTIFAELYENYFSCQWFSNLSMYKPTINSWKNTSRSNNIV